MTREIKILLNFTSYILLGLLICLIGLSDVFASTYYTDYGYAQQYYDNSGSSLTSISTTWNESLQSYVSGNITTVANSYGAGLSITSPIPIITNHTYTISIYFEERNNIALSSKPSIAIGNSLASASYNYSISNYWANTIQSTVSNNRVLQYVFKANGNANFIFIPWTTTSTTTASYVLTSINIDDLGSEGISQEDINTSLNNQTDVINDNINNLGEDIKDSINDNFNSCGSNLITTSNLNQYSNTLVNLKNFIEVKNNISYTYKINLGYFISIRFYDENKNYLGLTTINNANGTVTFNTYNLKYIDILFSKDTSLNTNTSVNDVKNMNPYFGSDEICQNKIDETNDKLDETNNQLGDLNNNITNDNIDDNNVSNAFNEFENFVDENATISTLLTLPVTLFSAILNGMQNSCTPFNLGSLYGENLILPCIDISSYLGNTLWTMIDIIISGFAIYFISQKFIKVFNNFSSMKEGDVIDD